MTILSLSPAATASDVDPVCCQVPPYVAKQWHEAIARAGQAADEDVMHTEVLGQVTIDNVSVRCVSNSSTGLQSHCHLTKRVHLPQGMATTLQVPGEAHTHGRLRRCLQGLRPEHHWCGKRPPSSQHISMLHFQLCVLNGVCKFLQCLLLSISQWLFFS